MDEIFQIAITITVFITMTLVGTDCTVNGLRMSLKRPGLVIAVGVFQFCIVPVLMHMSCRTLGASAEVTAGLILIACCPAGIISNTYCYLIQGNTSLSVSFTVIANLSAVILTPIALSGAYAVIGGHSVELQAISAGFVVRQLTVMVLLPMLIGAGIRAKQPRWIAGHQQYLRKIAMIPTVALLTLIFSSRFEEIVRHLHEIALITSLCTVLLFAAGWLISRMFHLSSTDRWAVLLELPCRNLSIAAVIGITILDRPELVGFSAAFFVLQAIMILTLFGVIIKRRTVKGISIG